MGILGELYGAGKKAAGGLGGAVGSVWDWGTTALGGGEAYTPQGRPYDTSQLDAARDQQGATREYQEYLAQKYRDRIEGKSPSVAEEQLRRATAEARGQQMSMARSSGGGALGESAAHRTAANNASRMDQQMAGQAALLRAQEQAAAEAGYGQYLMGMRGQDQDQFGGEADWQLGLAGEHRGMEGVKGAAHEQGAARRQKGIESTMGMLSGGAEEGGKMAAAGSDRAVKTDVRAVSERDIEDFLEAASAFSYKYKEGSRWDDGGRRHVGPMANDLEDTDIGRTMVERDPEGHRMVDTRKAYGAFLAGLGEIHDRVAALEKGKGR